MGEFPLVIFTVLSQLAVGALITIVLLDIYSNKINDRLGKKITLMILGITAIGLGFSLFHLGHPFEAYRALANLGSSWLSREVMLFSMFFVLLVVYYFQWQEKSRKKIIGIITSAVGLLAVLSSALVYVLPAAPSWNNFSTLLFFFFTAAVLGPLFVLLIIRIQGVTVSYSLVGFTAILLVSYLLSFIIYISVLYAGEGASSQSAAQMLVSSSFWLRMALSWLLPLGLITWAVSRKAGDYKYLAGVFLLVFTGEIIGRYLFYDTAVFLKIAGF